MLNFNDILHQPIRSKIMVALMKNEKIPFKVLKQMLDLSAGNLSTHLTKLEDVGYVIIEKSFENKKPKTEISISELGKKDFKKYANELIDYFKRSLE